MRCDDGLAWHAADELEKHSSAEVEIVRTHQLAPELAEAVSHCEAVIFIDAAADNASNPPPGEVRCTQIAVDEGAARFSHQLSSVAIVELAHQLFHAGPSAFSVTLTGACFDHGESLSPVVTAALPSLVNRIEELVQQCLAMGAYS